MKMEQKQMKIMVVAAIVVVAAAALRPWTSSKVSTKCFPSTSVSLVQVLPATVAASSAPDSMQTSMK